MKKLQLFTLLVLVSFFIVITVNMKSVKSQCQAHSTLEIKAEQNAYALGEKVFLDIKLNNNSGVLSLNKKRCGFLKLYIARKDQKYKTITGNTGLQINSCDVVLPLKLNKTVEKKKALLWNSVPETKHLNDEAKATILESSIVSHFVFNNPGVYFIKTRLHVPDENNMPLIESAPIQINIIEPTSADRAIFNQIKNRSDIVYFLHSGQFLGEKDLLKKDKKMIEEIEQLTKQSPNSAISTKLVQKIRNYKKTTTKQENNLKKLKSSQIIDNFVITSN